jgi:hypothetical protein
MIRPWRAAAVASFAIPCAATVASAALAQGYGTVSDGSCSCKTRCDGGKAIFSPGRTVAQCRAMCVKAFSGCTAGEIRLPGRRDAAEARPQRAALTATARSAAAPSAKAQSANSAARQCMIEQGAGYDTCQRRVMMRTTERDAIVTTPTAPASRAAPALRSRRSRSTHDQATCRALLEVSRAFRESPNPRGRDSRLRNTSRGATCAQEIAAAWSCA